MRKQVSRFVAIGWLALLAGCGGGGGGSGGSGSAPTDTTPAAFSFAPQTGTARATAATSDAIVVSGINSAASISITGGEYSIDGGSYTSASGSVSNNQTIRVRLTSSNQFSTPVTAVLTVGGVSASFTVTTVDPDTTPDTFQFTRLVDVTRNAVVTSDPATISGIDIPVSINIENGEYALDGGAFTSAAGTIAAGQSIVVRATASSIYSKLTRARVTVGTASVDFEVISEVPNYVPDSIVYDGQDVVYLLNNTYRLVFLWSVTEERYLDAYVIGSSGLAPSKMTYSSAHQRLYLGYSTGAIRYIDVTSSNAAEVPFANTAMAVNGLAAVGNYVLAQDGSGAWATHYVIDRNGEVTDQEDWNRYSREYAWDPATSRVYFFRDDTSPNDLHYEVIDQTTGQIAAEGETPYHGDYNIQPPIRVSTGGQYVLLGSGDIYNRTDLTWSGSLGSQVTDARWFTNGSMVTLSTTSNQTTLRRLGTNLLSTEQLTYSGQGLRVVGTDTRMAVLVVNNGTVRFHIYVPNDDSDGDGVTNTQDAFPLDVAASVDTDRDGYPDAWNTGRNQSDSTTGLSLDAYPQDSACYLASHGNGVSCDYSATLPNYVPDQVINQGDTVYLLSSANRRVYRWSIATGAYLNPYVVGINQGFSTLAPTHMAYSSSHQRLYLGYSTGAIQYIDVSSGSAAEIPFVNTAMGVNGLAAVGNYVLAQDYSGAWATHYVIDRNGVVTDQEDWNHYSRDYAWDPVSSRVYFFRDGMSPNDLHYEVIDQITGQITAEGETPYHGDYNVGPPIRVSTGGQYILLGNGDIYNRTGLTWSGSLDKSLKDAHWKDNLIVDVDTSDLVEIRDANTRAVLTDYQYLGQPIRLVFGQTEAYLVHVVNNTTAFVRLPFGDQDQDSMPQWWEQLYGLSDSDAADALGDLDTDGASNAAEYLNRSNPLVVDSDADGLTDAQEISTYSTDPAAVDSDGDSLNDGDEVLTHQSNPRNPDTDSDSYTDFDEVLYGGNPTNASLLPQFLSNYSESFENNPALSAWTTPQPSSASWTIDSTTGNTGSASLRSGAVGAARYSSIRFRVLTLAGQLSFFAKVDAASCCNQLELLIDGTQVLSVSPTNNQWVNRSIPISLGAHDIEWRYQRDAGSAGVNAAWIDDVTITP